MYFTVLKHQTQRKNLYILPNYLKMKNNTLLLYRAKV